MVNKKNITLKDIAENTGFSITTISHVINKTRHVDNDTKQTILESIKCFGYKISKNQTKKSKKSIIGVVIADIREDFFSDLMKYLETSIRGNGYEVIFCDSEQNPETEVECIKTLVNNNIDGLILSPTDISLDYISLKQLNIPTVLVDRNIKSGGFDYVGIDNFQSARNATKKFISLGLKNIAFIGYTNTIHTIKERQSGFKAAMLEAGLFNEHNILQIPYHRQEETNSSIYDFLKATQNIDAILCSATNVCYEVVGCINELYPNNPNQIKITTFDECKWLNYLKYQVSTISQPVAEIASITTELLLNKLKDPFTKTIPKKVILDYEYIDRF